VAIGEKRHDPYLSSLSEGEIAPKCPLDARFGRSGGNDLRFEIGEKVNIQLSLICIERITVSLIRS